MSILGIIPVEAVLLAPLRVVDGVRVDLRVVVTAVGVGVHNAPTRSRDEGVATTVGTV